MSVAIVAPNGGERFYVGRAQEITWTDTTSQNVKIELSINDGGSWTELEDSTASVNGSNSFSWTPLIGNVSEDCKIRITSTTSGGDTDTSAAVFTVLQPTINVLAPDAADVYRKGTLVGIRWDNNDAFVTTVNILLSTDSGSTFPQTIASGVAVGQGYSGYLWMPDSTIPGSSSSYANCRIKVVSAESGDSFNYDTSGTNFTVQTADNTPSSVYTEGTSNPQDDYPQRYEAMARVAVEKAVQADEALAKGQIYGDADIDPDNGTVYTDRASDGSLTTSNDVVIKTVRKIPRTLYGLVTLSTLDSAYTTVQGKYGNHYYNDIVHNWDLGSGDDANRFILETHNKFITSMNSLYKAQYEVIDGDTIRLHMVRKGISFLTINSKDQVEITESNTFYFKLTEVVDGEF